MIITDLYGLKVLDKVSCECDICGAQFERTIKNIKIIRKKEELRDLCISCSFKESVSKKPQCNKEYWADPIRKELHSRSIKTLQYYDGIRKRDTSTEHNGMYNKKHTITTKAKMSKIRTGKQQTKETILKRVGTIKEKNKNKPIISLNKSIKGFIHYEIKWYKRVYERDNFQCRQCNSKLKIDAHHIIPLSRLIKKLLLDKKHLTLKEQYDYLITQHEIIDMNLHNGITLCRICHKQVHKKWGSHYVEVQE